MRKTRFGGLGYDNDAPGLWRIYDLQGGEHAIGPHYASKAELLADLTRFATDYGAEDAS